MTTQQQTIVFCVLGVIAIPLATFTTIKLIHKLSRPPVNTLVRSGDIELVDVVQPTQPHPIYNQIDLEGFEYPRFHRISDYSYYYDRIQSGIPPTYQSGTPPTYNSYQSGTLPSYQSIDRFNINCSLENAINLDYVLWLILFLILVLLIWKLLLSYFNLNFKEFNSRKHLQSHKYF